MKIVKLIILSLILNLSTTNKMFAQWETQESGVNIDLFDVCFVDSLNGWILGDSATILTTNNGGKLWSKQFIHIDDSTLLPNIEYFNYNIEFINSKKGFIIGENGLVISTIDGGITWLKKENNFNYDFSDLSFVDTNQGWLTGTFHTDSSREAVILHTIDGGNTWAKQLEIFSYELFGSTAFSSIEFLNDSVGWAFGGDYADGFSATYAYYTNDGGESWNIIGAFESGPLHKLQIAAVDTLWGTGAGPFAISYDAGNTWNLNDSNYGYIYATAPINGMEGWIFESNQNKEVRQIMYTIDGGKSWKQELELESFVIAMDNYNEKHLWIVGENGLIMKRTGVITTVKQNSIIQNEFYLEQNYPNPFNPSTSIGFNLSEDSNVKLTVYNSLGEQIDVLIDEYKKKGHYQITYSPKALVSGVYIYSIESETKSQNKKMLFLK